MPTNQKVLGCFSSIVIIAILVGIGWFAFSQCTRTVSEPEDYECRYDAEQAIKRQLAFPSTFDEHELLTSQMSMDRSIITGDEERGWHIRSLIIFGTKNAFGVQSDYLVWYDGTVNPEGECTGVTLGGFAPYVR